MKKGYKYSTKLLFKCLALSYFLAPFLWFFGESLFRIREEFIGYIINPPFAGLFGCGISVINFGIIPETKGFGYFYIERPEQNMWPQILMLTAMLFIWRHHKKHKKKIQENTEKIN